MDMEGFVFGLFIALMGIFIFISGYGVGGSNVKSDCRYLGAIMIDKQKYECKMVLP